jgi:hypothetical protein
MNETNNILLDDIEILIEKADLLLQALQENYFGWTEEKLKEDEGERQDFLLHYPVIQNLIDVTRDNTWEAKKQLAKILLTGGHDTAA